MSSAPSQLGAPIGMGAVTLFVQSLQAQKDFYVSLVGLEVLSESAGVVKLGFGNRESVVLIERFDLSPAPAGSAGLYHLAILFASRFGLASAVQKILTAASENFEGSADHLVSEAFYFHDPEGNGVELYFDRPADTWQWHDGEVMMASIYIDPLAYIQENALSMGSLNRGIGHVHLRVGNIQQATDFYGQVLGFSLTTSMPTALFYSDGEYHHHLGLNVWESFGADVRGETIGLAQFEIILPNNNAFDLLQTRLTVAEKDFKSLQRSLETIDPWGTKIIFTSAV